MKGLLTRAYSSTHGDAIVACLRARLSWPSPAAASAQQNQPIYPVYDGFLKNPDGSYTLSFAYFSHNADTVTIAPGATNVVCADARRPHAADHVQARALALSVRDGGSRRTSTAR